MISTNKESQIITTEPFLYMKKKIDPDNCGLIKLKVPLSDVRIIIEQTIDTEISD